jgi:hypothetical protein
VVILVGMVPQGTTKCRVVVKVILLVRKHPVAERDTPVGMRFREEVKDILVERKHLAVAKGILPEMRHPVAVKAI